MMRTIALLAVLFAACGPEPPRQSYTACEADGGLDRLLGRAVELHIEAPGWQCVRLYRGGSSDPTRLLGIADQVTEPSEVRVAMRGRDPLPPSGSSEPGVWVHADEDELRDMYPGSWVAAGGARGEAVVYRDGRPMLGPIYLMGRDVRRDGQVLVWPWSCEPPQRDSGC